MLTFFNLKNLPTTTPIGAAVLLTGLSLSAPAQGLHESFDDASNISSIVYQNTGSGTFFSDGGQQYLGIIDLNGGTNYFNGDTPPTGYGTISNHDGKFLIVEDFNDLNGFSQHVTLTWNPVSISGFDDPHLGVSVADGHYPAAPWPTWDPETRVLFQISVDGAPFETIMGVESTGTAVNQPQAIDLDPLDGTGDDGPDAQIEGAFKTFTAPLPATGNTAELAVYIRELDGATVAIALDNLIIQDGPVSGSSSVSGDFWMAMGGVNTR